MTPKDTRRRHFVVPQHEANRKRLFAMCFLAFPVSNAFLLQSPNAGLLLTASQKRQITLTALGDFAVELEKPLGLILEERGDSSTGGVIVKELVEDGSAAKGSRIAPGDVLQQVDGVDVSTSDFDSVMELLIQCPSPVKLLLGDGLGTMDMPKNVQKQLKSPEDAFFVDAVVREAVREIRRNKSLGDLVKVEVIVGAGVKKERAMTRFFAIFSRDSVSTFSCNVAASGVRKQEGDNSNIEIVSLSCAKDEGLGQTYDLIVER